MKAAGIIAEYNPFHRGHQYHIRQTRRITKAECILAVMSGNFLQRGEAALYDKWTRAEMAVLGGADLVLELPAAFACNSAEYFAKGAVSLLEGLGGIQYLSFGCEVEDVVLLRQAAALLAEEPEAWKESLRKSLKEGESFAKARWKATQAFLSQKNGQEPFCLSGGPEVQERLFYALQQPNTILAVEYMKQLIRQKSSIEPVLIRREGSGFHEEAIVPGTFASAKAVRNALKQGTPVSALTGVLPQTTIQTALRYLKTSYPQRPRKSGRNPFRLGGDREQGGKGCSAGRVL